MNATPLTIILALCAFSTELTPPASDLAANQPTDFAPSNNETSKSSSISATSAKANPAAACWQVVVYDVDLKPICVATAFAVAEHLLATNAHVVEAVAEGLREGGSASVVQHDTGATFEIVWLWKHPGYKAGDSIGPDVGLLRVDEKLPAILRLAETEALHRISLFDPVRMYGFPEDVFGTIDRDQLLNGGLRPRATAAVGIITAMRPFYPLRDATPDSSLVLQHDLRSVGGNSGSPILNDQGHVVAVNAWGGSDTDPRLGFAIRSDVLDGLLRMVRLSLLPTVDTFSDQNIGYDNEPDPVPEPALIRLLDDTAEAVGGWPIASILCIGIVSLTFLQIARIRAKPQKRLTEAMNRFVDVLGHKAASTETEKSNCLNGESTNAKPK